MFKSFCILFWELLAKDKFSKGLEWQTVLNFTRWKATCIARVFKVATVTLLKVMGSAKISFMFSMSEKLPMELLSLLLVDSFCQTREGRNWHYKCYSTWSSLSSFAYLFLPFLKCLFRKPCRSCIAALYRIPRCLWDNVVQCKRVLAHAGSSQLTAPFPGQASWVIVLVLSLGCSLGQQGRLALQNILFGDCFSTNFIPFSFAGSTALVWIIVIILVVVGGLLLFFVIRKLKSDKGNCWITSHKLSRTRQSMH